VVKVASSVRLMGAHGMHVHPSDDVTIDYYAAGEGPTIVLVHGITESRRSWDPLFPKFLQAGYRVVLVDLRGHGDSSKVGPYDLATMAGDLGHVIAAEGVSDALLVGHSLGGAVVSAYAAGGPCRGVVNVDQPLALSGFKETLGQLEPMLRGTQAEFDGAVHAVFEQMAGPLSGAERERIDRLRTGDQDVVLGVWELVFTSSAPELDAMVDEVAAAITAPYLSLHGIDPGEGYHDWLTNRIATATIEVWPDLGHYPHLIEQDRFVDRVRRFDTAL
jgi:pimeloyl-ACP methyl ester carboxylesterase